MNNVNEENNGAHNNIRGDMLDTLNKRAAEEKIKVYIESNRAGKLILAVESEEKKYYLNSIYEDDVLIEKWCSGVDIANYRSIVLVFGIGNGEYIRKLREINREMLIIVYEPSYSVFLANICDLNNEWIISDDGICVTVGREQMVSVYRIISQIVVYETVKYSKLMTVPNYDKIFKDDFEEINKIFRTAINNAYMSRNTIFMMQKAMNRNIYKNIPDFLCQYGMADLIDGFDAIDKERVPAVIVSAGPSLDKNICDLKGAKGKAFIIAVDTALNPLARAGIKPDVAVTVDPQKRIELFDNELVRDIPLVFGLKCNEKIKSMHQGMRIYCDADGSIVYQYMKTMGKRSILLETGGSVAHDAFSLAQRMGFKKVIFIGQDLAYPNNQEHSADAYGDKKENDINKLDDKVYFEVEDIHGGKVKTEYNMNMYRLWFERAVMVYPDIKFIDATEGGAKKEGMEIMSLKEAIARECTADETIEFEKIFRSIPKLFSDEERMEIYNGLAHMDEQFEYIRGRFKEGKKLYDRLDEFNRKHKYTGREFNLLMEELKKLNDWATESSNIEYLHLYAAKDDYAVKDVIFEESGNTYEDIKHIVGNGIKMMDALLRAVDAAEEDMKELKQWAKEEADKHR